MKLGDGLNDPNKKEKVVADCLKLIDELVATAKGITGLGLKAAYTTVKGRAWLLRWSHRAASARSFRGTRSHLESGYRNGRSG